MALRRRPRTDASTVTARRSRFGSTSSTACWSWTSPEPDGLRDQPLPVGAWVELAGGSLAVLPYETIRNAADLRGTLLAFCQAAYEAGARLAGFLVLPTRVEATGRQDVEAEP